MPGSVYSFWIGLWAPAKTPAETIERLSVVAQEALRAPEARERLSKLGADPLLMSPRQFEAFLAEEFKSNENLVKNAGIKSPN